MTILLWPYCGKYAVDKASQFEYIPVLAHYEFRLSLTECSTI